MICLHVCPLGDYGVGVGAGAGAGAGVGVGVMWRRVVWCLAV